MLKATQIVVTLLFLGLGLYLYFQFFKLCVKQEYLLSNKFEKSEEYMPVIVWWTPFTGLKQNIRKCNYGSCFFTEDRNNVVLGNNTKAILFYGSDFKVEDLPLPRKKWHWWGLLHEESPKNQPLFDHGPTLALFNLTSTFKHNSGMPLTLQYLQNIDTLLSLKYFVPTNKKNILLTENKVSPILYLQSECNPPSQRDEYVKEISKFIPIDSYGFCLNNRELPSHLRGIDSLDHAEILEIIAKYKFTIAFENAGCEDYMTEKLWRPLGVGSVPIYWGSPSVQDWMPNRETIIHVRDFETPQHLAIHLLNVLGNDILYEQYLEHKLLGVIRNEKLLEALKARKWGLNEDQDKLGTFVEAFECYICDNVLQFHNNSKPGTVVADQTHYGCPVPETILSNSEDANSFWVEQWYKSKSEAEILSQLIHNSPGTFTIDDFYERVINSLQSQNHFKRFSKQEL